MTSMARGNFAHANAARLHGLGAGALGTRAAWNHGAWNHGNWNHAWNHWGNNWRGGWNGGCCGGWWFGGPVFWPFFAGDLLAFTFWPWGFYDPFWAYGNMPGLRQNFPNHLEELGAKLCANGR